MRNAQTQKQDMFGDEWIGALQEAGDFRRVAERVNQELQDMQEEDFAFDAWYEPRLQWARLNPGVAYPESDED